jgi:hypothetical protein
VVFFLVDEAWERRLIKTFYGKIGIYSVRRTETACSVPMDTLNALTVSAA